MWKQASRPDGGMARLCHLRRSGKIRHDAQQGSMTSEEIATRALELAERIKPLMAGQGSDVQGAVLLELVSLWLTGLHPDLREERLAHWIESLPQMVRANEHALGVWQDR